MSGGLALSEPQCWQNSPAGLDMGPATQSTMLQHLSTKFSRVYQSELHFVAADRRGQDNNGQHPFSFPSPASPTIREEGSSCLGANAHTTLLICN